MQEEQFPFLCIIFFVSVEQPKMIFEPRQET